MRVNERTAARIKAACDRLMETIPAGDRDYIEATTANVYLCTEPAPNEWTAGAAGMNEAGKYYVTFYVPQMKYKRRDFFGIVAHEFAHVRAGMIGDELTDETAAQNQVKLWGLEAPPRYVETPSQEPNTITMKAV